VVKENRTVSLRPVRLGPTEGDSSAVESGLAPGELVVVDGGDKLRDGTKVELAAKPGGARSGQEGDAPRNGRKPRRPSS